ncbi:hypothetical protein BC835DRAFT_1419346 [Cytidiella melzeri]|nr:hypothetical protein BC835DRAFT_1419346 [Cytidiella melzeri]
MGDNTQAAHPVSILCENPRFFKEEGPVYVSDAFNGEGNARQDNPSPDTSIRSSDHVYFAVHSQKLTFASNNHFAGNTTANTPYTPDRPLKLILGEPSDVLNILLHAAYGLPCHSYKPTLACLGAALRALHKYGMTPLDRYTSRGDPLYTAILLQAPNHPFETYALAAAYNLEELAVAASADTLHLKVHHMPSELADSMGARYLQRLYGLHEARGEKMKEIFFVHPEPHQEKSYCSSEQQENTRLDFKLECTRLFWVASTLSRIDIETSLRPIAVSTTCPDCKELLNEEIEKALTGFAQLRLTI